MGDGAILEWSLEELKGQKTDHRASSKHEAFKLQNETNHQASQGDARTSKPKCVFSDVTTIYHEACNSFAKEDLVQAYDLFTLGLGKEDGCLDVKIYLYRALAATQLGRAHKGVADCESVLALDPNHRIAILCRAIILGVAGDFEEAVAACENALHLNHDGVAELLAEAKQNLDRCKCNDYNAILGVEHHTPQKEIRSKYILKARYHHPDRFVAAGAREATVLAQARKFAALVEAYSVLSDPAKRCAYENPRIVAEWRAKKQAEEERRRLAGNTVFGRIRSRFCTWFG